MHPAAPTRKRKRMGDLSGAKAVTDLLNKALGKMASGPDTELPSGHGSGNPNADRMRACRTAAVSVHI